MKRTSTVVVLLSALAAAACSSTSDGISGPTTSGPISSLPTTSQPTTSGPVSVGPTDSGPTSTATTTGGYFTVSGRIVHQDTGQPYPKAWVRFGWLVNATYEQETHTVTDGGGAYAIQLPAGQYQVTAGDDCDLNAGFAIAGRAQDDVMITVPGAGEVDFVEQPITPGADIPGVC